MGEQQIITEHIYVTLVGGVDIKIAILLCCHRTLGKAVQQLIATIRLYRLCSAAYISHILVKEDVIQVSYRGIGSSSLINGKLFLVPSNIYER